MYDLIVADGRIVTPDGVVNGDVAIENGAIAAVGDIEAPARKRLSAEGRWVMPGGVDPHAHIEQISGMGQLNADTFETATRSAAMGGTTSVICFCAQTKGQRLCDAMEDYAARARRGAMIDHAFHISVSDPSAPDFHADLMSLAATGHRSIKVFTTYDIGLDDAQILSVLMAAKSAEMLVCVHAETDAILKQARAACLAAGKTSPRDHARARPRIAEIDAVARICNFAEFSGQRVMLFHISTAEAAGILADARARGVPVLAETCPHYLLMTADVLDRPEGGKWICSPPQRTLADQEALWRALDAGDLQLVSSDHAPYRYDETGKLRHGPDAPFPDIANGMPGLETRLPLLFDAMVSKGRYGPEAFARLTATAPADLYGLPRKGRIAVGFDADLVLWDPNRQVTYADNDLHDNVGYNPWVGVTVTGWPETVLLRGEVLVENGTFLGQPGRGQWLARPPQPSLESSDAAS